MKKNSQIGKWIYSLCFDIYLKKKEIKQPIDLQCLSVDEVFYM